MSFKESNSALRGSQTSMKSFTLKPTEPAFVRTTRSAWTPKLDANNNNKLFLERLSLITHWHDKWTDKQRKQMLVHLLQKTQPMELLSIRAWLMKHIPEPVWRQDPTSVLPKNITQYIFSFLTTSELCQCAQVSSHWRYLSEQDDLWRHRTAARGWFLPFTPKDNTFGEWKRYYVMCTKNSNTPSLLKAPELETIPDLDTGYQMKDLKRLHTFYRETDEKEAEIIPPSNIIERPTGDQETAIDQSLLKARWENPEKHPSDLKNWDKQVHKEYEPDITHLRKMKSKCKSKSYTKLLDSMKLTEESFIDPEKETTQTLTDVYVEQGQFKKVTNTGQLVTRKGIPVPIQNYWLQKPQKQTIGLSHETKEPNNPTKLLSADIGCGAVWGENIPGHTHPRVMVISSDVPAYEMIVDAVIPGVIGIVYDAERTPIRAILNQIEHSLNGRKAESIAVFAPGKLGNLLLTSHIEITGENLQLNFWRGLVTMLIEPKHGGRVDVFSTVGISPIHETRGLDIIYRLTGATYVPFNGPIGGIYGDWGEICGPWLLHPDHIHPISLYLNEEKVRSWIVFSKQLDDICDDIRERYTFRLKTKHTAGLARITSMAIKQALEVHYGISQVHLADILFYTLKKLLSEHKTDISKKDSDKVKCGILCMKMVDILLSSEFVKNLEKIEDKDSSEDGEKEESWVMEKRGKDFLNLLETDADPYILQTYRFIYPKGTVVDQRMSILEEIIRTERTFIACMRVLDTSFYQPLYNCTREDLPILNASQVRICFTDLLSILRVHEAFYDQMLHKQNTWSMDQTYGDVFVNFSHRFDCYSNYLNNYPATIAIYRKNINSNPAFWAFLEHFNQKTSQNLLELVIEPLNRIHVLGTLLKSALFYTLSKHPDYPILKQALTEFDKLEKFITQTKTQYIHLSKLKQIERQIINCPMLSDTKRRIVSVMSVYKVKSAVDDTGIPQTFSSDKRFPYFQKFKLYLFDDTLMLAKISYEIEPYSDNVTEKITFVNAFSLSTIRVRNTKNAKQFILYTPASIYLFECMTDDTMRDWADKINDAILNSPKLLLPNAYTKSEGAVKIIS